GDHVVNPRAGLRNLVGGLWPEPDVRRRERRDGEDDTRPSCDPPPPTQPASALERPGRQLRRRLGLTSKIVYGGLQYPLRWLPHHQYTSKRGANSSKAGTSVRSLAKAREVWLATVPARQPSTSAVCSTLRSSR